MAESLQIQQINALAELELIGWKYEPAGHEEIRCRCPAHEDVNPSVMLNTKKNVWHCHAAGCQAKGDIITFLAYAIGVERRTMIVKLSERYDLEEVKSISLEVVERMHEKVWNAGPLLEALRVRGLTDDDIRSARIGFHDGRLTIPVFDKQKRCVNIRRYLPGAPSKDKMKNTTGYGSKARLYQIEQLATFKDVWLLGGELKAVVAKRLLNKHGIGAVSTTVGEGNWDASFTPEFKGKRVYICYDVDSDGVAGARNAAMHLQYEAEQVYIVALPLDKTKYPKGDINDYVGQEGATDADLLECRDNAVRWERPPTAEEEDALQVDPLRVDLGHATDASNMVRPIEVEAVVSAMDTTPFIVAKEVAVSCTRDQPNCPWCPVKLKEVPADGVVSLTVKGSSPGVLEMIGSSKKFQREAVREALKIPPCKAAEFTVKTHMNVVDVRLSPQLTLNSAASEHVVLPAFVVQEEVELNTPYRFSGRLLPSPKNQQAVLLMSGVEQVEDSLDSFNPSNGELEELRAFSCSDKDVPGKISSIQEDLAANVTRIYKRY